MNTNTPAMKERHNRTVYNAALTLLDKNISILPCRGKEPAVLNWKPLCQQRASRELVTQWYEAGLLQNVGVIGGAVSGGLVMIDLDGWAAVNAFQAKFPALVDTYTVTSGSGKGQHVYLYARDIPPTTRLTGGKVGNIELRSEGAYVIAPPSLHPDTGREYVVTWRQPIARVKDLNQVVEWIKELIKEKNGGVMPAPAGVYQPVKAAGGWAAAALERECEAVRTAVSGSRNDTLNRAAFKLGQLVGGGMLERGQVERALESAAAGLAQGDGEMTVLRTIKSGLDAGMNYPRGKRA